MCYIFKDSTRMEKHRATKNTELTIRAPRTSARFTLTNFQVTSEQKLPLADLQKVIKDTQHTLTERQAMPKRNNITEHMKTIRHQSHRICDVAKAGGEPNHGKQTAFLSRIILLETVQKFDDQQLCKWVDFHNKNK